ncbi:SAM-dependent methyltransferase [Nonomuraea sp. NPDC050310]|uniref:SAM-dependent methyltransferase n=1 Tax=Nonomuraea sp. NPDC050310 TaxID=3154935 RepID=UPI0033F68022
MTLSPLREEHSPQEADITADGSFNPRFPHAARIYDYLLDGKNNFAADRQAAEQLIRLVPDLRAAAQANRAFLGRAFHDVAASGITQFLDIGCGLPMERNVHEVVQGVHPDARTIYVDNDLVVATHARALLVKGDHTHFVPGDLRDLPALLGRPDLAKMIDLVQPVGVGLGAVLHFLTMSEAKTAMRTFADRLVPGSMLIMSHACSDGLDPQAVEKSRQVYRNSSSPLHVRSCQEVADIFGPRWLWQPPGLLPVHAWRPDPGSGQVSDERHATPACFVGGLAVLSRP